MESTRLTRSPSEVGQVPAGPVSNVHATVAVLTDLVMLQKTEQLPADVEVMQKPFTSSVLAARVRRALDNGWPDVTRRSTSP
jgi:hypothetical protein